MILRNVHTAAVEVYDLSNNQITCGNSMGAVGLNWQFSGVGNFSGHGTSDMILRDSNTGALEVYDIHQQPDHECSLRRHPPTRRAHLRTPRTISSCKRWRVSGDSLNAASLSAETSQQTFLTTPQHT